MIARPPTPTACALALLAGVLLVQVWPTLPSWPSLLLLLLAGLGWFWRGTRLRWLGWMFAGMAWAALHGLFVLSGQLPPGLEDRDLRLTVRVIDLPRVEAQGVLRLQVRVLEAESGAEALRGARLRLNRYPGHGLRPADWRPAAGSSWRLVVRLRRPAGLVNPGGFDAERQALLDRIAAFGSIAGAPNLQAVEPARGLPALRERLSARIAEALPDPRGRFVRAFAVGDTRGLSDADWDVLRATGLTHLVAISGFHVGLVAGFAALWMRLAYRLLPGLGRGLPRPQAAAAAAMLGGFGYAALAGFALPTLRTALMIAAIAAAPLLRRSLSPWTAWSLALIVVLACDPLSVLGAGFWLSFVGVAWLMACLPDGFASDWRGWPRQWLWTQAVASLGLIPLTALFFGQVSWVGAALNLVAVPWISLVIVPLCLLGLALDPVSPDLSGLLWSWAGSGATGPWPWMEALSLHPWSQAHLPEPGWAALALACAGVSWLLLPRGVPGKALAALCLLPLLWPAPPQLDEGEAEVLVVDVGQGLAIAVRTRRHVLLYDAGPTGAYGWDAGESVVVPALRSVGIDRLDTLLISHGDADHAGGEASVLRAFPVASRFGPEGWGPPQRQACLGGREWNWDGVRFSLLHPAPWFPYLRNESSCVLRIDAAGASLLLTGDIGEPVERRLLQVAPEALAADVLLVPHHGSRHSSHAEFVAAVRPRLAIASLAARNRFGHPAPEVVDRYRYHGAQWLDTSEAGAIRLKLGRDGLAGLLRYRADRPRYWRRAGGRGQRL
jgi:competence protein ComEC